MAQAGSATTGWSQVVVLVSLLIMTIDLNAVNAQAAPEEKGPGRIDGRHAPAANQRQFYPGDPYDLFGPDNPALVAGASPASQPTSVALYKEPSNWVISILKEMFTDIDWRTIEEAQVQIEKFIRRVEQIVGKFRNIFTKGPAPGAAESRESSAGAFSGSGRWWSKSDKTADKMDATRVKEMLEKVACFVGYARLMNLSNEALAELDASKAVTNLFGTASKRNSSSWKWWG